jgi:hypothetical protein
VRAPGIALRAEVGHDDADARLRRGLQPRARPIGHLPPLSGQISTGHAHGLGKERFRVGGRIDHRAACGAQRFDQAALRGRDTVEPSAYQLTRGRPGACTERLRHEPRQFGQTDRLARTQAPGEVPRPACKRLMVFVAGGPRQLRDVAVLIEHGPCLAGERRQHRRLQQWPAGAHLGGHLLPVHLLLRVRQQTGGKLAGAMS